MESLEIKQCTNMEIFIEKLPFLSNLTCLTMKSCKLTDNLLQAIIQNLIELREIRLLDWTENLVSCFHRNKRFLMKLSSFIADF